jgi:hypothetical protein
MNRFRAHALRLLHSESDTSCLKAISKNEYTQIAQEFCLFSRRKKGRIASYVTLFTTQEMDKKTSKMGIFFAGNRLNNAYLQK